jgi:hypothetical protein
MLKSFSIDRKKVMKIKENLEQTIILFLNLTIARDGPICSENSGFDLTFFFW